MSKFFKDPYMDIIDLIFETSSFIDGSYKKSNVSSNDDNYKIQLAVPGLSKDDIKIKVKDSIISVSYEKEKTNENESYFTNSFNKKYSLPEDSDEKGITSKMENGLLEIVIPRLKKKTNERLITIN